MVDSASPAALRHHENVLSVDGLKVAFSNDKGSLLAVDGVSFTLRRGARLGIVGESGCGKSVTALAIMRLLQARTARVVGGHVSLNGQQLLEMSPDSMRRLRGDRLSMIFQEPMTALNPLMRIGRQIGEVLQRAGKMSAREADLESVNVLKRVGMPAPERRALDYPHQLSGGMRQRAMIAMAIACDPDVLIADEPTTALDVTVQAQIVDLLLKLQSDMGTAIIMISHDIGLIAEFCDAVVVMYAGQVIEQADVKTLFEAPSHPYTRGLMASVPRLYERSTAGVRRRLQEIPGTVPSLAAMPTGCRFADRCSFVADLCRERAPQMVTQANGSAVRCHFPQHGALR